MVSLEPTSQPALAAPATCSRHPDQRVLDSCARCGDYLCLECARYTDGHAFCVLCAPGEPSLAGRAARFFGRLIDQTLYATCLGIPYLLLWDDHVELAVLACVCGLLACFALNVALLAAHGQSVGKRLLGTRIVTEQGGAVPVVRTVLMRAVVPFLIGIMPGPGGMFDFANGLWVLGKQRRSLTDLLANTMVVEAASSARVYARRGPHST